MATTSSDSSLIDDDEETRRFVAILTWLILSLIPIYSVTETGSNNGPITETVLLWPWMVLIHYEPRTDYNSDQWVVLGFPWSFVLFIPTLYIIGLAWKIYISNERKVIHSVMIVMASFLQIGFVAMTYRSQDPVILNADAENVTTYYIPQLAILIIHFYFAAKWYYSEVRHILKNSQNP